MKRVSTIFLQGVIVLIGLGALTFLLWEPTAEGVNKNRTLFEIYFKDPFIAYAYLGSISFFVGLYNAFRLLGYIASHDVFSARSVKALGMIKKCAITLAAFIMGGEIYIGIIARSGKDDPAGAVMLGLFLIFLCAVVATVAAVFEKTLQSAVDLKAENDLTV